MKQITTRTHVLLQITLALSVATYIGLTSQLIALSAVFLGTSVIFGFLTIFSHVPKAERKLKAHYNDVCFGDIHSAFFVGVCSLTFVERV
jgi:hypothetical protein